MFLPPGKLPDWRFRYIWLPLSRISSIVIENEEDER